MASSKVTKRKGNTFDIQFKGLTKGEVLALSNALRIGRKVSAVAHDVSCYLRNGFHEMTALEDGQEFMDNINEEIDVVVEKTRTGE